MAASNDSSTADTNAEPISAGHEDGKLSNIQPEHVDVSVCDGMEWEAAQQVKVSRDANSEQQPNLENLKAECLELRTQRDEAWADIHYLRHGKVVRREAEIKRLTAETARLRKERDEVCEERDKIKVLAETLQKKTIPALEQDVKWLEIEKDQIRKQKEDAQATARSTEASSKREICALKEERLRLTRTMAGAQNAFELLRSVLEQQDGFATGSKRKAVCQDIGVRNLSPRDCTCGAYRGDPRNDPRWTPASNPRVQARENEDRPSNGAPDRHNRGFYDEGLSRRLGRQPSCELRNEPAHPSRGPPRSIEAWR